LDILVLPGDGIGPEITAATRQILAKASDAFKLDLKFNEMEIGFAAFDKHGTTLPDDVMEAARNHEAILLGPISHLDYAPRDKGGVNISAAVRVKLDLYSNVRPARTRVGVPHRGTDMDLIIVRECTEGMYPDRNMVRGSGEFMPTEDIALSLRKITRPACRRIAEWAFELASQRRKKVTAVHKANNFIITDGLFLEECRGVAKLYPDVELEEVIVDAMAAHLVRDATRYDVIVSTNFYSDILSDLASELSGGLGIAGSINANKKQCAAQAQHGSAPDIAGRDLANPTSLLFSATMMLDWIAAKHGKPEFAEAAKTVDAAIETCLSQPETRTRDLGGKLGTKAFGEAVIAALEA
jgi:3-isopropylmalate dehydrogenase